MDCTALGFIGEMDPRRGEISKTRRASILGEMMTGSRQYIAGEFLHAVNMRFEKVLGATGSWSLSVNEQDQNVVRFRYLTATARGLAYVVPQVVLEIGTHAEFVPRDRFSIRSFAAEEFPGLIAEGQAAVVALLAKRTFWEKATMLHAEWHRPPDKQLPGRYSRHYYDIAMLAEGSIRADALSDMALLAQVVRHKETFYPSAWAHYDLARPGSLRLLPAEKRVAALERDYRNINVMIFGEPPAFNKIMETLAALEQEINR